MERRITSSDEAKLAAREAAAVAAYGDAQGQGRRWQESSRPVRPPGGRGALERFWVKVDKGEHWLWLAHTVRGKGYFEWEGRGQPAARVSWEIHRGPIPPGMVVRITCGRNCVRPEHLVLSHRRNGDPYARPIFECTECGRPVKARGLCSMHLGRYYKRRQREKAVWRTDTEGQYLCSDCRRGLDDTMPVLVLGDDGMVPICGRCSKLRAARMAAAYSMDADVVEGTANWGQ